MGWKETLGDTVAWVGKTTIDAVKDTGKALHVAKTYIADHEDDIARGTQAAVNALGESLVYAGKAVSSGAEAVSREMHKTGSDATGTTSKGLAHAAGYLADVVGLAGNGSSYLGTKTQDAAPTVGTTTGGAVHGVAKAVSGAVDSVAITEDDFEQQRLRLQQLSAVTRSRSETRLAAIEVAQRKRKKQDLLDLLIIGGVSLADIASGKSAVPPEIESAFELAYPGLARAGETFADAVQRIPAENLVGLVSGVKGKLFEMELVEHLNSGHLPDGLHAVLAQSTTQPGYDIEILDSHGNMVDVLQAKATESVAYVKEALERYPDIDVTTTTEVHAQLVARGITEHVTGSGISDAVLQQKVEAAAIAGDSFDVSNLAPSEIGLAVIAFSSFLDATKSLEQKGKEFGNRAAQATVTGVAAKAILIATNTWWLGLAVGVGSRWLASHGGDKRERYEALKGAVDAIAAQIAHDDSGASRRMAPSFQE